MNRTSDRFKNLGRSARLVGLGLVAFCALPAALHAEDPLPSTLGAIPAVDPIADLGYKQEYAVNSWYFVGHFKADGDTIDYLYHIMTGKDPKSGAATVDVALSLTNETTGEYIADETIVPMAQTTLSPTGLNLRVPNGMVAGPLGALQVKAAMPGGAIDLALSRVSPVLYNGGNGQFQQMGMIAQEYSIPHFTTRGTIRFGKKTYNVEGDSWFDRQFQNQPTGAPQPVKWTWMDLNLDNGDSMSLWTFNETGSTRELAWATILHSDGSQTTTAIEPTTRSQSNIWQSPVTGQRYPTRWKIKIPDYAAEFDVVLAPKEQELVTPDKKISRMEGASTVRGTYRGKPITGFGYVELVGDWNAGR